MQIQRLFHADCNVIQRLGCAECGLQWFSPAIAGDGRFYEELQSLHWYYQSDKPEYPYAARLIGTEKSVLDVGCGRGAFASHLQPGNRYKGLEFNNAAVAAARQFGLDVTMVSVQDEARNARAYYDVVCHFQVLEHVPDALGFMKSCVSALKPGGKLIVTVPSEDSFLAVAGAAWLNMPPHHVTRWTDDALRSIFERLDVDVDHIWHEPVATFHQSWYDTIIAAFALRSLLGTPLRLEGGDFASRVARRLQSIPLISKQIVAYGNLKFGHAGRGHSVCISGTKRD